MKRAIHESVATAGCCRITAFGTPDGKWHETEYGRELREAEERRLAARTPAEVRRDAKRKREDDAQQKKNWAALYRAAGIR